MNPNFDWNSIRSVWSLIAFSGFCSRYSIVSCIDCAASRLSW